MAWIGLIALPDTVNKKRLSMSSRGRRRHIFVTIKFFPAGLWLTHHQSLANIQNLRRKFYLPNSCHFFPLFFWWNWHKLLLAISCTFQSWLSGPKCLQWFIRDLFSPSTNGLAACSLLAVWHSVPNSFSTLGGRMGRRCRGLMELFNSQVMGYCSSHNDSLSLC